MEKIVIIMNGNGGVGKDTLCDFAGEQYKVRNVSAITPIKNLALQCGWRGEKDPKSRKFLADLKRVVIEFNDYPYKYLVDEYEKFRVTNAQILFVHIREGEEIDKFKRYVDLPCITLLIRRHEVQQYWGNASDDNVERYLYDYCYDNDKPLLEARDDFLSFFNWMVDDRLKKGLKDEVSDNMFSQDRMASPISDWHLQDKKLLQRNI